MRVLLLQISLLEMHSVFLKIEPVQKFIIKGLI
jgi:hypothetical protein